MPPGNQGSKIQDVSITVPVVQKTHLNINKTNQLRDARERLVEKTKFKDARELLNQEMQNTKSLTDARQKLMTMRAHKESPIDARTKIQAKKLQGTPGQVADFTLRRTVMNKSNNNSQSTQGSQGNHNVSYTKTLTKIMPPGYESLTGASSTTQTIKAPTKGPARIPAGVKQRLGSPLAQISKTAPPQAPSAAIPKITRTITNALSEPSPQPIIHYFTQPQRSAPPYPPPQVQQTNVSPISYSGTPSQRYIQTVNVPPYPYQSSPPNQQCPAQVQFEPFHAQHQGYVQPQQLEPEVQVISQSLAIPRIEVQNDQYRPAEPQYTQYAAPYLPHYATAPYSYPPPPQQPMYYQTQQYEQNTQRAVATVSREDKNAPVSFSRTIVNDVPSRTSVEQSVPVKRKLPVGGYMKVATSAEPVKSSSYIPIVDTLGSSSKSKLSKITGSEEPVAKKLKEEDNENVISPLQGYKIMITNLASTVSYDDLIELFGAVGAVKSARLVKQGTAEVVYVKKDDAINGTKTYNDRELDGLPMIVKMVTPISARIKEVPEKFPSSVKPLDSAPLKLSRKPAGDSKVPEKHIIDVNTLHKALFKTGSSTSSKPVTFTVNI